MGNKMGHVEFTRDMVQTLDEYFDAYQVNDVVTIEVTDMGLWLPNPHFTSRQFLGLARLPSDKVN